jgi:hypothetical protein
MEAFYPFYTSKHPSKELGGRLIVQVNSIIEGLGVTAAIIEPSEKHDFEKFAIWHGTLPGLFIGKISQMQEEVILSEQQITIRVIDLPKCLNEDYYNPKELSKFLKGITRRKLPFVEDIIIEFNFEQLLEALHEMTAPICGEYLALLETTNKEDQPQLYKCSGEVLKPCKLIR